MRIPRIAVLIAVAAGMLMAVEAAPVRAQEGMTRIVLRKAYQREMDAQRMYEAYALRADLEGYCGAADLFDALVQAEQVHAGIHALRLEQMDEKPVAMTLPVVVGTTPENLAAAYDNEMLEYRTVYPRMADIARDEVLYDAGAGFGLARGGELTHARALAAAYFDLAAMTADHTYYLCKGCGRMRTEYSAAGCDCGAWAPKALAHRVHATPPIPGPVGPVAAR
jgi:rubrerythrin